MYVDVLIAGGGVAGLLLARALRRLGRRVLVADDPSRPPAARAAVGLLNPVLGRRFTLAWQAPTAIPVARETYHQLARTSERALFHDRPIVRVLRSAEERAAWESRASTIAAAGFEIRPLSDVPRGFRGSDFGAMEIRGAGLVEPAAVLAVLRAELTAEAALVGQPCRLSDVLLEEHCVRWRARDIEAGMLVLTGGAADSRPDGNVAELTRRGLGPPLPVHPVKGESLIVRAPDLVTDAVVVSGGFLAPRGDGHWVCGATLHPGADDTEPTAAARAELEGCLREMLTARWEVVGQAAGVRPVSPDRLPLVGRCVSDAPVYVLNGLGSRGFALAPWLAEALAAHLTTGAPLPDAVAPGRFAPPPADATRWHAVDVARTEALLRIQPGDTAIDLTVGNGGDTLWLAEAVGAGGRVVGFDIQPEAIAAARRRIEDAGCEARVELIRANHARAAAFVPAPVSVAVANLGHLPGSASPIITLPATTVAAFSGVLPRLRVGGALVAVIYVGHEGGRAEHDAVVRWAGRLDAVRWDVTWHRHPGRVRHAPVVLVVERRREE